MNPLRFSIIHSLSFSVFIVYSYNLSKICKFLSIITKHKKSTCPIPLHIQKPQTKKSPTTRFPSTMSLNNLITRAAVNAPLLPPNSMVDNHSVRNSTSQNPSCDKKCTAITLGVSLPLLFLLSVAGILYIVYRRRKEQRNEEAKQRKEDEEKEIALRKLGGSEVWEGRSASDGGSVRSEVEEEVRRDEHMEEVRIV